MPAQALLLAISLSDHTFHCCGAAKLFAQSLLTVFGVVMMEDVANVERSSMTFASRLVQLEEHVFRSMSESIREHEARF